MLPFFIRMHGSAVLDVKSATHPGRLTASEARRRAVAWCYPLRHVVPEEALGRLRERLAAAQNPVMVAGPAHGPQPGHEPPEVVIPRYGS
jgi:hypothetical protein